MGQLFSWSSPPSSATWNKVIVSRAVVLAGPYVDITSGGIAAKDSSGNWVTSYWDESGGLNSFYEVQYKNSATGVVDAVSSPIGSSAVPTLSYTSPMKVASLLQCAQFGGDTRPTIYEVIDLCSRVEDEIDRSTSHSWRTRYSSTTTGNVTQAEWVVANMYYEFHNIDQPYVYDAGIPIFLNHRKILQLNATLGDVIGVWNGSSYENFITTKTEGRNADYWLDYDMGVLYIRMMFPFIRHRTIQVKYRYGEQDVPGDVTKLATYLVAIDLALSDDRSYLIPAGGDSVKLDAKVRVWEERANRLKQNLAEFANVNL